MKKYFVIAVSMTAALVVVALGKTFFAGESIENAMRQAFDPIFTAWLFYGAGRWIDLRESEERKGQ